MPRRGGGGRGRWDRGRSQLRAAQRDPSRAATAGSALGPRLGGRRPHRRGRRPSPPSPDGAPPGLGAMWQQPDRAWPLSSVATACRPTGGPAEPRPRGSRRTSRARPAATTGTERGPRRRRGRRPAPILSPPMKTRRDPRAASATASARSSGGALRPGARRSGRRHGLGALVAMALLDQMPSAAGARSRRFCSVARRSLALSPWPGTRSTNGHRWSRASRCAGSVAGRTLPLAGGHTGQAALSGATWPAPLRPAVPPALGGARIVEVGLSRSPARGPLRTRRPPAHGRARLPRRGVLAARPRGPGAATGPLGPDARDAASDRRSGGSTGSSGRHRPRATSSLGGCTPSAIQRCRCGARR